MKKILFANYLALLFACDLPNVENPLMPMDAGTPITTPGSLNLPSVDQATVTAQGGGAGGNVPYNQLTTQQKLSILFGRGI